MLNYTQMVQYEEDFTKTLEILIMIKGILSVPNQSAQLINNINRLTIMVSGKNLARYITENFKILGSHSYKQKQSSENNLHNTHPPMSASGVPTIRIHRLVICSIGSTPATLPAATALALRSTNFSFSKVFLQYLQ